VSAPVSDRSFSEMLSLIIGSGSSCRLPLTADAPKALVRRRVGCWQVATHNRPGPYRCGDAHAVDPIGAVHSSSSAWL
jgi:hypothetical protein